MVKAPDYESGDSSFEYWQGHHFCHFPHLKPAREARLRSANPLQWAIHVPQSCCAHPSRTWITWSDVGGLSSAENIQARQDLMGNA